nr:hypothetical protein BdHM001_15990 [Bdellovibrio sp. HM001]
MMIPGFLQATLNLLAAVILGLSLSVKADSRTVLKISASDAHVDSTPYKEIMRFIKNALARDNIEVIYTSLPIERGSFLADKGDMDGELARIKLSSDGYSNLVETSFPFILVRYILVHRQNEVIDKKNISSLQGVLPLNVKGIEDFIAQNKLRTIGVNTLDAALDMLLHKRCDYVIMSDAVFSEYKKTNKRFISLEQVKDFSVTVPLYFRLNKKHKNLIPIVETAIKRERSLHGSDYPMFEGYYGF